MIAPASGNGPTRSPLLHALACIDAGDRWADAGERERALSAYGAAMDGCLAAGLRVVAASVAQRMIQRYPDVVRARFTLAVLSLAEALQVLSRAALRGSRSEFDGYLRAVRRSGRRELAALHLRIFADLTESPDIREQLAEHLEALGDRAGAEAVFLEAYEEREGIRPPRRLPDDQLARWTRFLLDPPLSAHRN